MHRKVLKHNAQHTLPSLMKQSIKTIAQSEIYFPLNVCEEVLVLLYGAGLIPVGTGH